MPTQPLDLKMRDGQIIRGVFVSPDAAPPVPAVIFVHGFGSTRRGEKSRALEDECGRRGWAFAAFDFRGHGESDGTMLELRGSRLLEELDAITTAVAAQAGGPLFLIGSSLGGWAAAWFAARHPGRVTACALVAPALRFLEFLRVGPKERDQWRRTGWLRVQNEFVDVELEYGITSEAKEFQVEQLALEFRTPAILFHGLADDVVPWKISTDFVARATNGDLELMLFKNGDHRLNRERDKLARLACDFFAERVNQDWHTHSTLNCQL
jgi:pimeloyl-ACP methyl ester carboxylesterase